MIIYSESFHVEFSIEQEWLQWMKEVIIPKIEETKIFNKAIFSKVISHSDETGNTYSIQYYTNNKQNLENFHKNHSQKFAQLNFNKFGTKILSFKTELDLIDIFDF